MYQVLIIHQSADLGEDHTARSPPVAAGLLFFTDMMLLVFKVSTKLDGGNGTRAS